MSLITNTQDSRLQQQTSMEGHKPTPACLSLPHVLTVDVTDAIKTMP